MGRELAQVYINEVKLQREVIQFLLGHIEPRFWLNKEALNKVEAIKARYGRG